MDELIIYDDSTYLSYITINGRISKKLFEKVITPKIKELEARNKDLEEFIRQTHDILELSPNVWGVHLWQEKAKKLLGGKE